MYGTLEELLTVDFGPPLHCLALCGETHPLELEVLNTYIVTPSTPRLELTEKGNDSDSESER